jgi:hypothetical protein
MQSRELPELSPENAVFAREILGRLRELKLQFRGMIVEIEKEIARMEMVERSVERRLPIEEQFQRVGWNGVAEHE